MKENYKSLKRFLIRKILLTKLNSSKDIKILFSRFRRRYFWYFKKNYVVKQIKARKGSCLGCGGKCCIETNPYCRYLSRDRLCIIYDSEISFFCKIFPIDNKDIRAFRRGVTIDNEYKCMPAELEIKSSDEHGAEVFVTIQEGKFHQVKKMFKAREKEVVYLRRVKFGPLEMDESIPEGQYRELTKEEVDILKNVNA